MKKLSAVIAILLLASCGGSTQKTDDVKDIKNPEVKVEESKFYPITVIKSPQEKNWFGLMLNVPDGFKLDEDLYKRSGDFVFMYKDNFATFSVKFKQNPGKNDAENFLDMEVIKQNKSAFTFGTMEKSGLWTAPFPTMESTVSGEATAASVSYVRKVENVEINGTYFVWWFVAPLQDTSIRQDTFAIVISQECLKKDFEELAPKFEIMRKTLFRLPSRGEVTGLKMSEKYKNLEYRFAGLANVTDRLFPLQNGEPLAPMWETLIGKFVFALDKDRFQMYLVPNVKTPSGLLPHPTIEGWTVDPALTDWLTDYLDLI